MTTIAIDTETQGLDLFHGARPFFVTICDDSGTNTWWEFPVDPMTRQVRPSKQDLDEIADAIEKADVLVLQNAKFDYVVLKLLYEDNGRTLPWDWNKVRDTLYAAHLLDSASYHDLTTLAARYLKYDISKFERELEHAVKECLPWAKKEGWRIAAAGMDDMPSAKERRWKFDSWLPKAVAEATQKPELHPWRLACSVYANADSTSTFYVWGVMEKLLAKRKLRAIFDCRMKLLPVICEMEAVGITISGERTNELVERFGDSSEESAAICTNIAKSMGHDLELPKSGVNGSLTKFLLEVLKLPPRGKTPGGKPSLNRAVLTEWELEAPERSKTRTFLSQLRSKRKCDTGINYLAGYKRFWVPLLKGKERTGYYLLHPSLNATGTHTLRMSSSNPNEQNISSQDDVNLRYAFGPAPGREWWSLDAANIELRIPAYEAGEEEQIALFEKPDDPPYFGSNHLLVCHILHKEKFEECLRKGESFKDKYKKTLYQWTKNGNFAVQYGAVEASGTADRAYHVEGAQARIQKRFRKVSKLNEAMIAHAQKHGYVETIPDKTVDPKHGYPLTVPKTQWGSVLPTVPLNYHVQGTAMWWMCKAMLRCHEYLSRFDGYHLVAQIHDELLFDFPKGKSNLPKIRKIQRLMEQGGDDIGLPTPVSVTYHPNNWSEGETIHSSG